MSASGYTDTAGRAVTLHEVDDENWRAVADVAPLDGQRAHAPALAARYLLLSMRGGVWNSLAVCVDGRVVGHVMWARDEDGSYWIGGLLIDGAEQGRGVGRAATAALSGRLAARGDCRVLRLSYAPGNTAAGRLYASLGFRVTGDTEGDEVVAELAAERVPPPSAGALPRC
ncbi:GNAT family N-acetyltransferase [Streptomyces sanyensis]|uniref:GNAT family N-acetyltransferase n=1 Tax=Streptomyces sanyensis TaxID=568869 RepID=UPI003D784F2C